MKVQLFGFRVQRENQLKWSVNNMKPVVTLNIAAGAGTA